MNIYVGNLPYSVRDEELRATFEPFGTVVAAEVIFDKRTRRSRGYGFVEMPEAAEGQRAIEALNGKEVHGRELRVDASQPKGEREPGESGERSERTGQSERGPARSREPRATARPAAPAQTPAPSGLKGFFKRLFG